jgi:hypothetical protein
MAKRKRRAGKPPDTAAPDTATPVPDAPASGDDQIAASNLSLHDLFQQQVRGMLEDTDLDEEAKQGILIAAGCPCCGAGGMSFTAKIKRRS